MLGMMLGSLRVVWPWQTNGYPSMPQNPDATVGIALLCCMVGLAVPFVLNSVSTRKTE
jgi:uncharacterized membrane protein